MNKCNPVCHPMVPGFKLMENGDGVRIDNTFYKQIVGNHLYLTVTRLDVIFVESLIKRFMDCPTGLHFQTAQSILRYLKGLVFKEENLGIQHPSSFPLWPGRTPLNRQRANVLFPDTSINQKTIELLDAQEDEYDGILIDPDCLPLSANAFVAALRTSISAWKQKGKKGVWLKILAEQADLVPIAIKEGFSYHHAEPGYAMLTYWIPNGPCMLPSNASHQVGVGGFVINDKKEVLVVKEKQCPCQCSGIWKFPTGFINQSEELFTGAVREVKEETGIDTAFVEVIAFRHAHQAAFEKSDLLFICMLKPQSFEISIDESEIEAAKWMPLDEFLCQPFYQDDCMSKKVIDMCVANYENRFKGLTAHHVLSKLDGNLSYLYYGSNGLEKD
ncbi:nudix hydrolase 8-like [Aristolochia californica]|uniref:nudix hydrolase 8-like n=1 Tax=Aristolochia californica TaxID=171875 RepID=UPI0035E2FA4D